MQEVVNQFMEKERGPDGRRIERILLCQQTDRKLMEGQKMNVHQCKSVLDAEQPLQPLPQSIGRNDDGKRSQRVGNFELPNILDKSDLQIRMERSGNNLEHGGLTVIVDLDRCH